MTASARLLFSLPALLLALILLIEGACTAYFDLAATSTATELSFWGRENYKPTPVTVNRTGQTLSTLLKYRPMDPAFLAQQAYYLSWQGFFAGDIEQRLAFNQQAVTTQYQSLQQRPAYRQGWAEMVEYASRTRGGGEMLAQAQQRIAALQPARN
ncbi:MAG: hypothetical protein ABJL54_08070 [Halioglobus sp.]